MTKTFKVEIPHGYLVMKYEPTPDDYEDEQEANINMQVREDSPNRNIKEEDPLSVC